MRVFDIFQKTIKVIDSVETKKQYITCEHYVNMAIKKIRQMIESHRNGKKVMQDAEYLIGEINMLLSMKYKILVQKEKKTDLEQQIAGILKDIV